jgi:hypothetical protein
VTQEFLPDLIKAVKSDVDLVVAILNKLTVIDDENSQYLMKALPSILRHSPFSKRESILGVALEEFI